MDVAKIPSYFNPWLDHMKLWHNLCSDNKILPQVAALRWACSIEEISYVVVGIQSKAQLEELIYSPGELPRRNFDFLAQTDKELLNPMLWKL